MGYVVLAPNIRGSSGYGKAFEDANNPCWTHCDLRDVVQGVALLKTLPYVQAARMGITGNSYGGIMSMGAISHAPGVFQAAAVTTPAFVLHGDGVTQSWRPSVYPIPASLELVHALDQLNKVVKYKVYPGETYYVGGRESSKQALLDILEWFDRYLKDS